MSRDHSSFTGVISDDEPTDAGQAAPGQVTAAPDVLVCCHIDIVGGCQLRCVGCPNSTLLPKAAKTATADFARFLAHIDVGHIETLRLFNYGEPLLHDDLAGILHAVAAQRWKVGLLELSTNAQFVRWEVLEKAIATRILNRLVVSCDGDGTAESYEMLRPPGKWPKLLDFLDRAARIRDRHDPELELMTRTVISSSDDQDRWNALLRPKGWTPEFRGWKALPESRLNMTGRQLRVGRGVCKFLTPNQLYVAWDGTVVPCCAHPRAAELGNLGRQKLSEILAGQRRVDFLSTLDRSRSTLPICGQCEFGPAEDPGPSAGFNLPS